MKRDKFFDELHRGFRNDPEYLVEGMLFEVAEAICLEMKNQGINRAELAKRLNVERQYVTQFLNNPTNTTLLTIVRFAQALNVDVATLLTGALETAHRVQEAQSAPEFSDLVLQDPAEWSRRGMTMHGFGARRQTANQNLSRAA
jgi:transcriptional regulator with XRE-family HTH domain